MCRWIAYIGQKQLLLEDLLIDAPHPIVVQINEHYLPQNPEGVGPAQYNFDGFGVLWYTDTRSKFDTTAEGLLPSRYRTTSIVGQDETFKSICANSASPCILAHVRAAAGPGPIAMPSNHPFIFGRHSFMHNGWITDFNKIKVAMLALCSQICRDNIYGGTDTETFAALYFTYLGDFNKKYTATEMRNAMGKALATVNELQYKLLKPEEYVQAVNYMNLCATDGESLCALRWRSDPLQIAPGPLPSSITVPEPEFYPLSLYVSYDAAASLDGWCKTEYNKNQIKLTPEQLKESIKPAEENLQIINKSNPDGKHVIVASEPATFNKDQWFSIENGHFILVDCDVAPVPVPGKDQGGPYRTIPGAPPPSAPPPDVQNVNVRFEGLDLKTIQAPSATGDVNASKGT